MKYSLALPLSLLGLAASAAAQVANVTLEVISSDSTIDGKFLTSIHESAGVNYVFLADSGDSYIYDYGVNTFFGTSFAGVSALLQVDDELLTVSVLDGYTKFDIVKGNTLAVNGSSSGFYACKNTGDPYSYSTSAYQAMFYSSDAPSDCIPFTIEYVLVGQSAKNSSSTTYSNSTTNATSTSVPTATYTGGAGMLKASAALTVGVVGAALALVL
ncbi:hypothetical protein BZA70DRAFT_294685 [Myxozyma melibiosi]|uniref:DUF7907 domain-containing protein n=1 Tax=Myxozyma melibiosi TaxID=54550 RepID=A0ABR1F983_9ASCO